MVEDAARRIIRRFTQWGWQIGPMTPDVVAGLQEVSAALHVICHAAGAPCDRVLAGLTQEINNTQPPVEH